MTAPSGSSPARGQCLLLQVKALEVDGKLREELFPGPTDAGLRHLLPGILDMPNSIINSELPPMTPHHILLEFHPTF